jgi:hypothetical protein
MINFIVTSRANLSILDLFPDFNYVNISVMGIFQVLIVPTMKVTVVPFSMVETGQCLSNAYCLHLQGEHLKHRPTFVAEQPERQSPQLL